MAVPPYNPGFSETPPFAWVSGVQWNTYRLVAFFIGQHGDVGFRLQFAGPKHFYTQGELRQLAKDGQKTQVPVLQASLPLPAETASINGSYVAYDFPFTTPIPISISGDALYSQGPTGRPEYRGFTTLQTYDVEFFFPPSPPAPSSPVPFAVNAAKKYFHFDWRPLRAADLPAVVPLKGLSVGTDPVTYTGDDKGTVYVRVDPTLPPIDTSKLGVAKYDRGGNLRWRIGTYPDDLPDTVIYDDATGRVGLVYLRLPGGDGGGVKFYSTRGENSGSLANTVTLPDNVGVQDCSRNGKLYGYGDIDIDATSWNPIKCYSPTGSLLWTVAGEDIDEGYRFAVLTAYGEDYIFVTMANLAVDLGSHAGDNPPSILGDFYKYQVRDAHTGALVYENELEPNIVYTQTLDLFSSVISNRPSYGRNTGLTRSAYWP